ncbi:MAG: nucleoside-diphosphate kinase [Candidatus Heimdallarchaeota archaeon]|nr:nucleoside-diphosphate kinase [Candidatus Heimdallarchaeota archaeon]MDH5644649.1 nucleoside-diphosphate kinase [Candidatus Heimdallarchaeota archaeon]
MKLEKEFIMIKPDAVQRGLIGLILTRIQRSGLKLLAMKFLQVSQQQAEKHYEVHKERPFYPGLVKFITSGPVVAIAVEGLNAVEVTRKLVGATNPKDATPGTIRGDFALDIGRNLIHASDSVDNALTELSIYFNEQEYVSWSPVENSWLYE